MRSLFPALLLVAVLCASFAHGQLYTLQTSLGADPWTWNQLSTWLDQGQPQNGGWSVGAPFCCTVPGVAGAGGTVNLFYSGASSCVGGTDATYCDVEGTVVDGVVMAALTLGKTGIPTPRPVRCMWTTTTFTSTASLNAAGAVAVEFLANSVSSSYVSQFLAGGTIQMDTAATTVSVRTANAATHIWSGIVSVNVGSLLITIGSSAINQLPTIIVNPAVVNNAMVTVALQAGSMATFQGFFDVRKACTMSLTDAGARVTLAMPGIYVRGGFFILQNNVAGHVYNVAVLSSILAGGKVTVNLQGGTFNAASMNIDQGICQFGATAAGSTVGFGTVPGVGPFGQMVFVGPQTISVTASTTVPVNVQGVLNIRAPVTFTTASSKLALAGDYSRLNIQAAATTQLTTRGLTLETGTEVTLLYSNINQRNVAPIQINEASLLQGTLILNVSQIAPSVTTGMTFTILSYTTRPTGGWTQVLIQGWSYLRVDASNINYGTTSAVLTLVPQTPPTTQCIDEFGRLVFGNACLNQGGAPSPPPPMLGQVLRAATLTHKNTLSGPTVLGIVMASNTGVTLVLGGVFATLMIVKRNKLRKRQREAEDATAMKSLQTAAPKD